MNSAGPRWRNVFVMSGTILFTLTGIFGWHRVMALYLRDLGASPGEIGFGTLMLGFSNRIPQLFGGWMADRIGRKRIVVVITTLMGCCYIAIGLAHHWGLVVAFTAVCWILGGFQWPALLSLVADSVPTHQRGRAMGLLEAASMTGLTVGPLVGGFVLERHALMEGGWTILLVTCGLCYFGSATARGLFLVETSATRTEHGFLSRFGSLDWKLLAFPVATIALALTVGTLATDGPFQSFYLKDVRHLEEPEINYVNAVGGLVSVATALFSGWLSDRLGSRRVILISFSLSLLIMLVFVLPMSLTVGAHPALAVVALVAIFAPSEMFTVAYQKEITTVAPEGSRALYVGAAGLAAGMLTPWCLPTGMWMYEHADESRRGPFWMAAATAGIGVVVTLVALARGRRAPPIPVPSSPAAAGTRPS